MFGAGKVTAFEWQSVPSVRVWDSSKKQIRKEEDLNHTYYYLYDMVSCNFYAFNIGDERKTITDVESIHEVHQHSEEHVPLLFQLTRKTSCCAISILHLPRYCRVDGTAIKKNRFFN